MLEITRDLDGIQYRRNDFQFTTATGSSCKIYGEDPFEKPRPAARDDLLSFNFVAISRFWSLENLDIYLNSLA